MKMKSLTSLMAIVSIASLLSASVSASTIGSRFNLSEDENDTIDKLKMRYRTQTIRPKHCPLESTNYSEITAKLNTIKDMLFQCSSDKSFLDEVTTQTSEIQDSIGSIRETTNDNIYDEKSDIQSDNAATEVISGQSILSITSMINTALRSKECKDTLESKSFLDITADTIFSISQISLLVPGPNGMVISAGAAIMGSVIKLLDSLLNKGYDFENSDDRNNFVKLNCSFYDLRRELEEGDAFKVYARENEKDLFDAKAIIANISDNISSLNSEYEKQVSSIQNLLTDNIATMDNDLDDMKAEADLIEKQVNTEKAKLLKGISGLEDLKKLIDDQISIFAEAAVTITEDDPAVSQMINKLYLLELVAPILIKKLKEYTPLSSSIGQDRILIMFLGKLDYEKNENDYLALQTMEVDKFNNVFRARLLAGLKRVSNDIGKKQGEVDKLVSKKMDKLTQKKNEIGKLEDLIRKEAANNLTIDGKVISSILIQLEQERYKALELLNMKLAELQIVREKLENYTQTGLTREDQGTSSRIDLTADFNSIANNIYGKNGYQFLMQSKESSETSIETFDRMFESFSTNYLIRDKGIWDIRLDLSKEEIRRGCQDGKPFIRTYTTARDWKELGYDFLATNGDLFHGYKNDGFILSSDQEKIQEEYNSVIFTRQSIKGEKVPEGMEDYVGQGYGRILQKVQIAGSKASIIQRFIQQNDCSKMIEMK
ncbi:MAG: hypothetical protein KAG61_13335 [Bacteriovoracaceae bacterium]|nr:hypothetical protein [Bacteriovoracaceae bacterium]